MLVGGPAAKPTAAGSQPRRDSPVRRLRARAPGRSAHPEPDNAGAARRSVLGSSIVAAAHWFPFWLPLAFAALFVAVMASGHRLGPDVGRRLAAAARHTGHKLGPVVGRRLAAAARHTGHRLGPVVGRRLVRAARHAGHLRPTHFL
jgi:hypothetical protein